MDRLLRFLGLRKRSICTWRVGYDYGSKNDVIIYYCTVHHTIFDSPTQVQKHLIDSLIRKVGR